MKRLFFVLMTATLVIGLVWLGCSKQYPTTPEGDQNQMSLAKTGGTGGSQFAPDRILVEFSPRADVAGINAKLGASEIDEIPALGVKVLRVPAKRVEAMVAAYNRNPNVEYAEPDYIYHAVVLPDDQEFSKQWGLHNTGQSGGTPDADIDAPEAWDVTTGSSTDKIAILDSGIDQNHEDLQSKIVDNKNFTDSPTVDDLYGHGTHVAGIAAAVTNNGIGVAGVAWKCQIMNVKVLGDDGIGNVSWIANGITWAADNGARVINLSLGGYSTSRTIQKAVRYAWKKGVVIVAAAGNDNINWRHYPASYNQCIAVAATDRNDAKASFSNWGSWVDVAAPGDDIFSTLPNHDNYIRTEYMKNLNYDYLSGTSMASPFVSGIAALVWSTSYGTSNESVRDRIESTCDQVVGTGTYWAHGRVNAFEAVKGAPPTIDVIVLFVTASDISFHGNYNITADIQNQGISSVTIHVDCMVKPTTGKGRKQKLTTQKVTIDPSAIVTVTWDDASKLKKGSYVVEVTVQEDPDVGTNNTSTFEIQ